MKSKFFPMFMDISEKKILFVGAGKIATRRVKVLNEFETNITVVAPEISEELQVLVDANEITYINDAVSEEMDLCRQNETQDENCRDSTNIIDDYDIVFICTDDYELNHKIYNKCKEKNKLVNNCSNHEECDFYFPGIVQKENVVVGVNAGGNAHRQAKDIREKIQEIL